jgi:hypothetical protein
MIIVLLMQFKIGTETIEQKSYKILTASTTTQSLHQAAEGAVLFAKKGYEEISKKTKDLIATIRENNKDNAIVKMWSEK